MRSKEQIEFALNELVAYKNMAAYHKGLGRERLSDLLLRQYTNYLEEIIRTEFELNTSRLMKDIDSVSNAIKTEINNLENKKS
jgi:hypothetical protein